METRFTVKFENEWLEQSYRFAQTEALDDFEAIRELIDNPFIQQVEKRFEVMRADQLLLLKKQQSDATENAPFFDDIV